MWIIQISVVIATDNNVNYTDQNANCHWKQQSELYRSECLLPLITMWIIQIRMLIATDNNSVNYTDQNANCHW